MAMEQLKEYLDGHGVKYTVLQHSKAFTASEIAQKAHVPGKEMAKSVIVKVDGKMAMAVLPSTYQVDFERLREAAGAGKVELASEDEFGHLFTDCELGAMPPFGNVYGLDVYVAERLTRREEIVFNACSHTELVRMSYEDFARLAQPTILKFST